MTLIPIPKVKMGRVKSLAGDPSLISSLEFITNKIANHLLVPVRIEVFEQVMDQIWFPIFEKTQEELK